MQLSVRVCVYVHPIRDVYIEGMRFASLSLSTGMPRVIIRTRVVWFQEQVLAVLSVWFESKLETLR